MKKLLLFLTLSVLVLGGCKKEIKIIDGAQGEALIVKVSENSRTKGMISEGSNREVSWDKAIITLIDNGNPKRFEASKSDLENGYMIKNVIRPDSVKVSVNGGTDTYTSLAEFSNMEAKNVPEYGKTGKFTQTDKRILSEGKEYSVIEAALTLSMPISRIEIGDISFKNEGTNFGTINLSHVYVDKVPETPKNSIKYSVENGFSYADSVKSIENFADFDKDSLKITVTGGDAFINGIMFPGNNKYYAFNIFGQGKEGKGLPSIRLHFTNCGMKSGSGQTCASEQYAVINKYVKGNEEIKEFEPGKIYRITGLKISDANLSSNPEKDTPKALVATVTVSDWVIEDIQGTLE